MPQMQDVYSSTVRSIGHDPETNELHVEWKSGKTSVYSGVDADKAGQVMGSGSIGQALHSMVKNQHPHEYK